MFTRTLGPHRPSGLSAASPPGEPGAALHDRVPCIARAAACDRARHGQSSRGLSAIDGNRVSRIAPEALAGLDRVELVRLYHAISGATGNQTGTITQFVGGAGGDSMEIAYSSAWIGAALLGKRVLFIDASMGMGQRPRPIRTSKPLWDVVRQPDLPLFLATLQHERPRGNSVITAREINGLLEQLRHSFDMIMIAPPPALEQPLAAILTAFVDGSVLVVEAGVSGARSSAQIVHLLRSGGSPILGAVLSRRKSAFPRWLRRLTGALR